jgi:predicted lipid-binding transport protein (Tim44 family)
LQRARDAVDVVDEGGGVTMGFTIGQGRGRSLMRALAIGLVGSTMACASAIAVLDAVRRRRRGSTVTDTVEHTSDDEIVVTRIRRPEQQPADLDRTPGSPTPAAWAPPTARSDHNPAAGTGRRSA